MYAKAMELEKQGLSRQEITQAVEQMLKQNERSNTDRVIDAIIKDRKDTLTEAQQANLREILVSTFVSGRKGHLNFRWLAGGCYNISTCTIVWNNT